jgi:predicted Zn finger-like uncharacterized protein
MIVQCENCQRKFNLNENLLKHEGSRVRCTKCGYIFVATPPLSSKIQEPSSRKSKISLKKLMQGKNDRLTIENRTHHRIKVSVPASCTSIDSGGNSVDLNIGRITDISQDGLAIELFCNSLSESTLISFITLEDKEIQITGKVIHSRKNSKGKTKVGVALTGTPKEISDFVSNVVRYHHYATKLVAEIIEEDKG